MSRSDNSAHFRLLGGPYHDSKVLLFAPWDDLLFMDKHIYELHGPLTGGEWVYTYKGIKDENTEES